MERVVRLERVANLRGLGGLPTADGRRVARGRLFRSGSLHEMTDSDRRALESLGIRIVIDLRSLFEQGHNAYSWSAGRVVPAPLAGDKRVADIFAKFQGGTISEQDVENWWHLTGVYDIPVTHRPSMQAIFATILEAGPDEGVLLHCTGGKDRTGVASAFVLEVLGVTREAILEDFLLSNVGATERAAEFIAWMRRATGLVMAPEVAYWLAAVKGEWLETMLQQVADRYGSVAGYLSGQLGFGAADLDALRRQYLEAAGA